MEHAHSVLVRLQHLGQALVAVRRFVGAGAAKFDLCSPNRAEGAANTSVTNQELLTEVAVGKR